jgi:hypothetical protein
MNQTNNVRNILLRTLFDSDFHSLLLANPERAIKDYDLTENERQLLIKPTTELYRYVSPIPDLASGKKLFGDGGTPPTTTTTTTNTVVAVIVVVAIVVFVTAIVANKSQEVLDLERFHPLINAIKNSSGSTRFDLVRTLINEITKEH